MQLQFLLNPGLFKLLLTVVFLELTSSPAERLSRYPSPCCAARVAAVGSGLSPVFVGGLP